MQPVKFCIDTFLILRQIITMDSRKRKAVKSRWCKTKRKKLKLDTESGFKTEDEGNSHQREGYIEAVSAPLKKKKWGTPKNKSTSRKLFVKTNKSFVSKLSSPKLKRVAEKIAGTIDNLVQKFSKQDSFNEFVTLFSLLEDDSFPMDNLSFRLFLETVKWHRISDKRRMTYYSDTLTFWKIGYRLFKEKFVLFLGGDKSNGFAAPTMKIIRDFNTVKFPKSIPCGIIEQTLENFENSEGSHILSFDGKKLAQGLNKKGGEVDLFGHEEGETAANAKACADDETARIQKLIVS
ncbi:unnamed protein product, partial [Owenia fusiformis]